MTPLGSRLAELNKLGLVKMIPHPDEPLMLYDYTIQCQIQDAWEPATLAARGLVLDLQGEVVSRPFDKFFNVDEQPHTKLEALAQKGVPAEISEKVDGSMVEAFYAPSGRPITCTRGSWASPQAVAAKRFLDAVGAWPNLSARDSTYLFEYTAPWNRIVIPYSEERLFLLGVRARDGEELTYAQNALLAEALGFPYPSYRVGEASQLDMRAGTGCRAEGFVLRYPDGLRVKMKYLDYKELHRIVTGFNVKSIWKMLANGQNLDLPPDNLPDEFYNWFIKEKDQLKSKFADAMVQVDDIFRSSNLLGPRRDIALGWKDHPHYIKSALFARLDGKDYKGILWKSMEPSGDASWFKEDKAPA